MFGTIYVLTNPFLSFLCIDSIKALRFEPFAPITDNKAFKRLAFAISRFEVEGVEGVLTCGVEGLWGCMVARLNVTHTEQPATCGIEESTSRTHTILQLTRCFLHF